MAVTHAHVRTGGAPGAREEHWPHPFPPPPPPEPRPPEVQVHAPMVFVPPRFEYKHEVREGTAALDEAELNTLGAAGWELTGILAEGSRAHFYFKRESQ